MCKGENMSSSSVVKSASVRKGQMCVFGTQDEHTLGFLCFFFNDTATTEIYTLSLHDALPIWARFSLYSDEGLTSETSVSILSFYGVEFTFLLVN